MNKNTSTEDFRPVPAPDAGQDGSDAKNARSSAAAAAGGNMGEALRSVYQRTVEEDVPDEMIDLLGRLD